VIVHSFYTKGGQTTIYRCQPDKLEVLSVNCGASDIARLADVDGFARRHSLSGKFAVHNT
jgi:hypothetical protein